MRLDQPRRVSVRTTFAGISPAVSHDLTRDRHGGHCTWLPGMEYGMSNGFDQFLLCNPVLQRPSGNLFVRVRSPDFRRVDKRDSLTSRFPDRGNHFPSIGHRRIRKAHLHTAKSKSGQP